MRADDEIRLHRIVHGYDAVDADRLWDTAMLDVPRLIALLETKLPSG